MSETMRTGQVKWFNAKKGFGFISTTDGDETLDVFVHHNGIQVGSEQYKYLVQGEYVSFTLTDLEEGDHKHQASNVTGLSGGKLMCEIRNENPRPPRPQRSTRGGGRGRGRGTGRGRGAGRGRGRGSGTEQGKVLAKIVKSQDGDEWTVVPVKSKE